MHHFEFHNASFERKLINHDFIMGNSSSSQRFTSSVPSSTSEGTKIAEEEEDMMELVNLLIENDGEEFLRLNDIINMKKKKTRNVIARSGDLWQSGWGIMMRDPSMEDPNSFKARKFRRRFRMPWSLFKEHVEECRQHNIFEMKYETKIPVEFRVLVALRILGRDACADEIEEFLNIGESTANYIFKQYITGCVKYLYPMHVKVPTGEMLDEVRETYARLVVQT